jgi:hypothetical protein
MVMAMARKAGDGDHDCLDDHSDNGQNSSAVGGRIRSGRALTHPRRGGQCRTMTDPELLDERPAQIELRYRPPHGD